MDAGDVGSQALGELDQGLDAGCVSHGQPWLPAVAGLARARGVPAFLELGLVYIARGIAMTAVQGKLTDEQSPQLGSIAIDQLAGQTGLVDGLDRVPVQAEYIGDLRHGLARLPIESTGGSRERACQRCTCEWLYKHCLEQAHRWLRW